MYDYGWKVCRSHTPIRSATHLSLNTRKWGQNAKNKKCIAGCFAPLSSLFAPGSAFAPKLKGFLSLFFCGNKETQNSHEVWKVCGECFVYHRITASLPIIPFAAMVIWVPVSGKHHTCTALQLFPHSTHQPTFPSNYHLLTLHFLLRSSFLTWYPMLRY